MQRHGTYNSDECKKKLRMEDERGKPYFDFENSDFMNQLNLNKNEKRSKCNMERWRC